MLCRSSLAAFSVDCMSNFQECKIADRAVIMVAHLQRWRQRTTVRCLTCFLGCRCHGSEQASGNTTRVRTGTNPLLHLLCDFTTRCKVSVCLSHAGIASKRLNISSHFFPVWL